MQTTMNGTQQPPYQNLGYSNGHNGNGGGGPFPLSPVRPINTRDEIADRVKTLSRTYPARQFEYEKALSGYDSLAPRFENYNAEVQIEASRRHSEAAANQRQADEEKKKITQWQNRRGELEREKADVEAAIAACIGESRDKEQWVSTQIWPFGLQNVTLTLDGLMDALRLKFGAENLADLRERHRRAKNALDEFLLFKNAPVLSSAPVPKPKEDWKAAVQRNLLIVPFTLITGSFTGILLLSVVRIPRLRWDPTTIGFLLAGILLITALGYLTGKVIQLAYDDRTRRKMGRPSGETMIYASVLLVLLAAELFGDTLGLRMQFLQNQAFFSGKIPSIAACPIALFFALPVMLIKAIQTSTAARERNAASTPEEKENDLRQTVAVIAKHIEEAIIQEKELEAFIAAPGFGEITSTLGGIEKLKAVIKEAEEKRAKIEGEIKTVDDDVKTAQDFVAAKEADVPIAPTVIDRFREKEDVLRRDERDVLNVLWAI